MRTCPWTMWSSKWLSQHGESESTIAALVSIVAFTLLDFLPFFCYKASTWRLRSDRVQGGGLPAQS